MSNLRRVFAGAALVSVLLAGVANAADSRPSGFDDLRGIGSDHEFRVKDAALSAETGQDLWYTIRYTKWLPKSPNGRVIVYNHGFQSHRGWFYPTANEFAARGYTVYAFDRIGSGESSDGYAYADGRLRALRGHVRHWSLFLDTLEAMIDVALRGDPQAKVVLWGNSYGAKVVEGYLLDRTRDPERANVVAAVLTVPGLYQDADDMPLPFRRREIVLSRPTNYFPVPMSERDGDNGAAWFVAPGEWFERIQRDERSLREVTGAFYIQTASLDRFIAKTRASRGRADVPSLFLMVRDDPMMDNRQMVRFIDRRVADAYYKFFRGGEAQRHFLLFTEDRDEALGDILEFLDGRGEQIPGIQRGG